MHFTQGLLTQHYQKSGEPIRLLLTQHYQKSGEPIRLLILADHVVRFALQKRTLESCN